MKSLPASTLLIALWQSMKARKKYLEDLVQLKMSGNYQKFRPPQDDPASPLFQNSIALPLAQEAAHGERRYVGRGGQILVVNRDLNTIRAAFAYSTGKADEVIGDP